MDRALDLLIVDDDHRQSRLLEVLMAELSLPHRCHLVENGRAAIDFLRRSPSFESAPRPGLILLDLNMPGLSGCDVLGYIKSDPALLSIPVVILSTSDASQDVNACYKAHANAYIQKPTDLQSTLNLLRDIDRFWGKLALSPS